MVNNIQVKLLNEKAQMPTRGTAFAAGFDLYVDKNTHLAANSVTMCTTGISMAIPNGMVGLIFPRSGLSVKHGLTLANCVGVIDADYRGEIKVAIRNLGDDFDLTIGDRIAQIVFMSICTDVIQVNELNSTERGAGGFGSTGTGSIN